ncbi:uncharacterized protein LOC143020432 [Oratosquilla oratoria]|uniref:uncharacterized protein LOC143020432 n=1 Tax=Oratosquilla oratoria TaxID=337810 RepID=UPI003F75E825
MEPSLHRLFFNQPGLKQAYRQFESSLISSKKRKNQHQFLVNCLEEQVCPISFGFHKHRQLGYSFPAYISEFLKERIKITSIDCDSAYHKVRTNSRNLKFLSPSDHIYKLLSRLAIGKASYISAKHKDSHNKKLTSLCRKSVWSKFSLTDNVANLSDQILTKYELEVLGLGVNFAMKPDKSHVLDYIVGFDKFMAVNDYDKDLLCLKGVLLQGIMDCFKEDRGLPKRADKGGKLVILNQHDYDTKALNMLADRETYEVLTKNPLKTTATEFNKEARKIIGNDQFNKLRVFNPQLPNFYGLPKIHKEGIPLRPIISNRNSCTNKVSKWLTDILSPLVGNFSNSHIKLSEDFVDKIKGQNIPNDRKLLSLDIVS